jgi:peptidyl-dipeptidase Dcp
MHNPLFSSYTVPPVNDIREEHILPALKQAIENTREKFREIRDNPDMPTFENTVGPFDTLYDEVNSVARVFELFYLSIRTGNIQDMAEEVDNLCTELASEFSQDPVMGARLAAVYDARDKLGLDSEDLWLLENLKKSFENTGAMLPPEGQKQINEIDRKLIRICNEVSKNMHKGQQQQAFLVTDESGLAGVPEDKKAAFRDAAGEAGHAQGWLFTPERLLVDELLSVAENRDFRRKMHEAMDRVGKVPPYNNAGLIKQIQALRDERAKLLGYENYAQYSLSGTMAGSVGNVRNLFDQTLPPLLKAFEEDMAALQDWVDQQGGPQMEPYDVQYYAARYKKEELGYDGAELAEYLEVENILSGWIEHASRQMEMTFRPLVDYPVWDPEIRVFEVTNNENGKKSLLYIDLFARPGTKEGGAWMNEIQCADSGSNKPDIIIMNMNLVKPKGKGPVRVCPDQVKTFFHEGGHALNGLKGTRTKYFSRKGTGNGSDYAEIHSMMSENWAFHPEVAKKFAVHHKTGELLPEHILDKKEQAANFMASWQMLRLIQNARRDLNFHSLSADEFVSDEAVEDMSRLPSALSAHVRPYPLTRFGHLFSEAHSEYAAGYYGYFWSETKASQAFELFRKQGIYNPASLRRVQDFFAIGAGKEPNEAFEESFGTKGLDVGPLLSKYGIKPDSEPLPPVVRNGYDFDVPGCP